MRASRALNWEHESCILGCGYTYTVFHFLPPQTYCDWGLDYLKNDNCGGTNWKVSGACACDRVYVWFVSTAVFVRVRVYVYSRSCILPYMYIRYHVVSTKMMSYNVLRAFAGTLC